MIDEFTMGEPENLKEVQKTCPKCGAVDKHKFRYLNNKKIEQPRYQCLRCKTQFTYGGLYRQSTKAAAAAGKKEGLSKPSSLPDTSSSAARRTWISSGPERKRLSTSNMLPEFPSASHVPQAKRLQLASDEALNVLPLTSLKEEHEGVGGTRADHEMEQLQSPIAQTLSYGGLELDEVDLDKDFEFLDAHMSRCREWMNIVRNLR